MIPFMKNSDEFEVTEVAGSRESAGSKSGETSRNSGMSLYDASRRNLNAHPVLRF